MWGLVYTALSFLAALHPRGVRRISAISCLDLSTTGKSDFLLPVFTIFPHYCPIFLYIAHYSHSALLARQLYRGQEIVRTGKNFGKNHSPSPHTTLHQESSIFVIIIVWKSKALQAHQKLWLWQCVLWIQLWPMKR